MVSPYKHVNINRRKNILKLDIKIHLHESRFWPYLNHLRCVVIVVELERVTLEEQRGVVDLVQQISKLL